MKNYLIGSVAAIFVLAAVGHARAGLINYDRQKPGQTAPSATTVKPVATVKPAAVKTVPVVKPAAAQEIVVAGPNWMITVPVAQNDVEKGYDINSDGKLQTAEVKIYLRDVVDEVDTKGFKAVDSGVLKEYDRNQDGLISAAEADKIREDVNK
jgi:hypothetical protein